MRRAGGAVLLAVLLLLCGCGRARPDDLAGLAAEMAKAGGTDGMPGVLYAADLSPSGAALAEYDAMPASLAAAAYGAGGTVPGIFARLEGYAVWLCTRAEPIEYGCFVVQREGDTGEAVKMCLARQAAVASLCGGAETPPPLVIGRCVFYAVGPGALRALETARVRMSA